MTGGEMRTIGTGARAPARSGRRLLVPVLSGVAIGALALGFVVYALWPRWPAGAPAAAAPHLPIVIAGETFHVPPAAIRMAVQRQPGAQERIDLVYAWPTLAPAAPPERAKPLAENGKGAPAPLDRLFVSIAGHEEQAAPAERLRTIYLRYADTERAPAPAGLALVAFREGSPYQGEDLVYDESAPDRFIARCNRSSNAAVPATCLLERFVGQASVVVRFQRAWLPDWRALAAGLDRLIAELRPKAG